jgi:hypothetical protein
MYGCNILRRFLSATDERSNKFVPIFAGSVRIKAVGISESLKETVAQLPSRALQTFALIKMGKIDTHTRLILT